MREMNVLWVIWSSSIIWWFSFKCIQLWISFAITSEKYKFLQANMLRVSFSMLVGKYHIHQCFKITLSFYLAEWTDCTNRHGYQQVAGNKNWWLIISLLLLHNACCDINKRTWACIYYNSHRKWSKYILTHIQRDAIR